MVEKHVLELDDARRIAVAAEGMAICNDWRETLAIVGGLGASSARSFQDSQIAAAGVAALAVRSKNVDSLSNEQKM